MFKFLKDKLKKGIARLTRGIEKEGKEEIVEEEKAIEEKEEEPPRKKAVIEKRPDAPPPHKKETKKEESKNVPVEKKADKPKKATQKEAAVADKEDVKEKKKGRAKEVTKEKKVTSPAPHPEAPAPEEKSKISPIADEKPEEKKGFFSRVFGKKEEKPEPEKEEAKEIPPPKKEVPPKEAAVAEKKDVPPPQIEPKEGPSPAPQPEAPAPEEKPEEPPKEKEPKKKGVFSRIKERIVTTRISEEKFEELFWDLELALLESNVAVQVIEKIKTDLKRTVVDTPIKRGKVEETILGALRGSIDDLLTFPHIDLIEKSGKKRPYVVCFVGINGSGKTTTIAKVARMLLDAKKTVVLAAADTFRAAAIDQLQHHADKLGVKLIKHDYGSDPAAVAFDAVKYADQKLVDVVLIDTAGRLHSATNLIEEMKKIVRVARPDMKVFVGESITGNDCIEQAERFNEAIDLDGIILSKADIDEKGGAALSVAHVTGKPILYIGTGQGYTDIKPFDKAEMLQSLGIA